MKPKPHISTEKKEQLATALDIINKNPIIGIVNMESLPAQQLQTMKRQLRGKVRLFMTKKRLIKLALQQAKGKDGLDKLDHYMRGMPALLGTTENPFSLYKTIKKNKSAAPAKAGQTATKDIIIKAGPTPFAPGPIIGELGQFGIKAGIEAGKVAVKEDRIVCKEGEIISAALAAILQRLNINPMEIGLDVLAVYEHGTVYSRSVLDIDEEKFLNDIATAGAHAVALALETGIPTADTTLMLIQKAARESKALAREASILTSETVADVLAKAQAQAQALNK